MTTKGKMTKAEIQYELQRIHDERTEEIKIKAGQELEAQKLNEGVSLGDRLPELIKIIETREKIKQEIEVEIDKVFQYEMDLIERDYRKPDRA